MSKRTAAVEDTRRRIVQATARLHNTQGILTTSWEDIAKRADVSPATVYRHFPSLEDLLPACGAFLFEELALPSDEQIEEAFRGATSRPERLRRMVEQMLELYVRGEDMFREVRYTRASLEPVQEGHEQMEERLDALVRAAIDPDDHQLAVIRALTDYESWRSLRARGFSDDEVVDSMVSLAEAYLRS
jgi:AcrR family transcriptional regulator